MKTNPYKGKHAKKQNPLIAITILIIVVLIIRTVITGFIIRPFEVPSSSMYPEIQPHDIVMVNLMDTEPVIEDIVVFKSPLDDKYLIKRLIAKSGQTVDLKDGKLYVDGEEINYDCVVGSTYALEQSLDINFPYTVPEGKLWLMGDNREHSQDSRYFGAVDEEDVVGIAVFRYWPIDRFKIFE